MAWRGGLGQRKKGRKKEKRKKKALAGTRALLRREGHSSRNIVCGSYRQISFFSCRVVSCARGGLCALPCLCVSSWNNTIVLRSSLDRESCRSVSKRKSRNLNCWRGVSELSSPYRQAFVPSVERDNDGFIQIKRKIRPDVVRKCLDTKTWWNGQIVG